MLLLILKLNKWQVLLLKVQRFTLKKIKVLGVFKVEENKVAYFSFEAI